MTSRLRTLLAVLLVIELIAGLGALGWRFTRPAAPTVNLGRLPASTAADLQRLQQQVRSDQPSAWLDLGKAYLAYGYFPEAEACLKRAIKLSPKNFDAVFAHAYSLDRLCRLPESNAEFREAAILTAGSGAANCWYHIGVNHLRMDDAQQAEQAFGRAGDFPAAVHARAKLLARSGKAAEAVALIESLRREVPMDIHTEMLAVQVFRELNQPVEIAKAAERAERSQQKLRLSDHWEYLHPIRARYGMMAQYARAQGLVQQEQVPASAEAYQLLLKDTDPEFTDGMFEQAVGLQLMAGRADVATQMLERFGKRLSLSPVAIHLQADALLQSGKVDQAIPLWESANRFRPDPQSYHALSVAHEKKGEKQQAERDKAMAALFRGIDAYRHDHLPEALRDLGAASKVLTDDARPWFYAGEVNYAMSRLSEARKAYARCVELDPDHGRALERLELLKE